MLDAVERSMATLQSRSQLEPGKTMTADFMSDQFHPIALDHRIGQQTVAQGLDLGLYSGAVSPGNIELDHTANADVTDAAEAERVDSALNGLTLNVENARLEEDVDLGFHQTLPP